MDNDKNYTSMWNPKAISSDINSFSDINESSLFSDGFPDNLSQMQNNSPKQMANENTIQPSITSDSVKGLNTSYSRQATSISPDSSSTSNKSDAGISSINDITASGVKVAGVKSRKLTSEEKDNQNPAVTSDGKPRKHIRRACLECRKRHIKCDGVLPVCSKCVASNRECNYVPSHRGGLRIPRNKQQKQQAELAKPNPFASPCMLEDVLTKSAESNASLKKAKTQGQKKSGENDSDEITVLKPQAVIPDASNFDRFDINPKTLDISPNFSSKSEQLQPLKPIGNEEYITQYLSSNMNSNSQRKGNVEEPAQDENALSDVIDGVVALSPYSADEVNMSSNSSTGNIHSDSYMTPTNSLLSFPENKASSESSVSYPFDSYVPTPLSNIHSGPDLSLDDILTIHYTQSHKRHPILPRKDQIQKYLDSIDSPNELVLTLGLLAHITTNVSSQTDISDLKSRISHVFSVLQSAPDDIVKLQATIILIICSHLSTDNATSSALRKWLFQFLYLKLSAYNLSSPASEGYSSSNDSVPIELFMSSRLNRVDRKLIREGISRVVHEAFFLEVLFSLIASTPLTQFSLSGVVDTIPISNVPGFAYHARYRTIKVARSILCSLLTVGSGIQFSTEFTRLEALTTTFQGFLSNNADEQSQFPPLINDLGVVDDGIHQSIVILNFAAIILHFPFSNLYQNRVPSYVECTDTSGPILGPQRLTQSKYRSTVSTRKCIEAANHIVQIIPDIGSTNIPYRTPLYSCSLAMAMLVHMKAYHWLDQLVPNMSSSGDEEEETRKSEIGLYKEYIKLSSNALTTFSQHWILSGKLNTSLCNVMFNVLPELYEHVVETKISQKRKASEALIEKDCWMKQLDVDLDSQNLKLGLDIFDQIFDLDK